MPAPKAFYDELYEDYVVNRVPVKDMAEKYGYASYASLSRRLRGLGIPPRDHELADVSLSSKQRQVVIGGLLGDATARPSNSESGNVYIKFAHTSPQQEYVKWKHEVMQPFSRTLSVYEASSEFGSNDIWEFVTATLHQFVEFREAFYPDNGEKIVPDMVEELDALGLAVWFLDDGTIDRTWRRVSFCTSSFSEEDHDYLLDLLERKFKLQGSKVWTTTGDKKYRRIALSAHSFDDFKQIVEPHIIPSMRYKISC